jgi:hypothetical protein
MNRENIKILTFAFSVLVVFCLLPHALFASVLSTEKLKTHLRWKLKSERDDLSVSSRGDRLLIRSRNLTLLEQLKKDLSGRQVKQGTGVYLDRIATLKERRRGSGLELEIPLASDFVDIFSFYHDSSQQMVIDFWLDQDVLNRQRQEIADKLKSATSKNKQRNLTKKKAVRKKSVKTVDRKKKIHHSRSSEEYRDFRYGAPIVWDYKPYQPHLESLINLDRKTPEFFYPIENREFDKSESEAHLQLAINLYRRKKWGLMYKSIQLYQKKYGEEKSSDFISYLKANALIRINLEEKKRGVPQNAISLLTDIVGRSKDYEYKKALFKYLIAYFMKQKDYVQALNYSKMFYVASSEKKDQVAAKRSLELILANLAHNSQLEALQEVMRDKVVQALLPRQMTMAYELFVLLKLGKPEVVVKRYGEMSKKLVLASPVNPAILFNMGEALFRVSRYQEATKFFDQFVHENSLVTRAADARLRIALSYEIMDRDIDQTLELYLNAINRSQRFDINYEARLRYVALRTIRKINTTAEDREVQAFLELDEIQRNQLKGDLKNLLWLVRLRTYIANKRWVGAITYLNAVPLITLKPSISRIFNGDGAEVIYGIIDKNYRLGNYSRVIKTWEIFKDRYIDKVLMDTYLNFIVARSYLGLKLTKGYQRTYQSIVDLKGSPTKTYPIWVDRTNSIKTSGVLGELNVLKKMAEKKWDEARSNLQQLRQSGRKMSKLDYYSGLINYKTGKLRAAVTNFERFFSKSSPKGILDGIETAELLDGYLDSLYRLKLYKKFMRVSTVVLKDINKAAQGSGILSKVLERIAYLRVEMIAGESDAQSQLMLESEIRRFQANFSGSVYRDRVSLILGTALIKMSREKEGEKILRKLSNDKEVPSYIRELARSELTFLEIKNKTI